MTNHARTSELFFVEEHELPREVVVMDIHSAGEHNQCNANACTQSAYEADHIVVLPAFLFLGNASVVRHVEVHYTLDILRNFPTVSGEALQSVAHEDEVDPLWKYYPRTQAGFEVCLHIRVFARILLLRGTAIRRSDLQ